MRMRKSRAAIVVVSAWMMAACSGLLASCGAGTPAALAPAHATGPAASPSSPGRHPAATRTGTPAGRGQQAGGPGPPLPAPVALVPFGTPAAAGEGAWSPAGRPVGGTRAVYGPRH